MTILIHDKIEIDQPKNNPIEDKPSLYRLFTLMGGHKAELTTLLSDRQFRKHRLRAFHDMKKTIYGFL